VQNRTAGTDFKLTNPIGSARSVAQDPDAENPSHTNSDHEDNNTPVIEQEKEQREDMEQKPSRKKGGRQNRYPLVEGESPYLVFRVVPIPHWCMGSFMLFCFIWLIYHFAIGRDQYGKVFVKEEGIKWWMILMVIFLGLMSFVFILSGKVKKVTFDKRMQWVELCKTSVLC